MRLTFSLFRSSAEGPDGEQSEDSQPASEVTIYRSPVDGSRLPENSGSETTAAEFVPASDDSLIAVLEDVTTPATTDTVTDRLIEPEEPPIETWAAVHEQLHQVHLPRLDDSGAIEFDSEQGTIESVRASTSNESKSPTSALGVVAVVGFSVLFIAWMTSILTALTFTFVVATIVAWFVPVSGVM